MSNYNDDDDLWSTHDLSGPPTPPTFGPQENETAEAYKARLKTETTAYHDTVIKITEPAEVNKDTNTRRWDLLRVKSIDILLKEIGSKQEQLADHSTLTRTPAFEGQSSPHDASVRFYEKLGEELLKLQLA